MAAVLGLSGGLGFKSFRAEGPRGGWLLELRVWGLQRLAVVESTPNPKTLNPKTRNSKP